MICLAAAAIGGSTLLGTLCGFGLHRISGRMRNAVVAFAAGVMLAAAVLGLYLPAIEMCVGAALIFVPLGTAAGILFLRAVTWASGKIGNGTLKARPELLFVLALALHKLPEGMAGGVGWIGTDLTAARTVVIGIAIQNLPEGAVMIPPMLAAGVSRRRAACIALATGALNAAGVFAGALWGSLFANVLPFALAFAGGAMLDVIVTDMIPQTLRENASIVTGGFVLMMCLNAVF